MRGIRRSLGTAPQKKAPATAERIISMALAAGDDMKGLRDRALLLIGFAGAFLRSELVALNVEDLEESELGFKVTIRHSKTDQEGAGKPSPSCQHCLPGCRVEGVGSMPPASLPGRYFARSRRAAHWASACRRSRSPIS